MVEYAPIPAIVDRLGRMVVDAAFRAHRELGPGLLESVYETCLTHEIDKRGTRVRRKVGLPLNYDGIRFAAALRIDILVENTIIIEVEAVERMLPVFEAQLLSYLRLAGLRLGYLINFNVPVIRQGIKRYMR